MVAPPASAASKTFERLAIVAGLGLAGAAAASAAKSKRTEMVLRRGETSFPEFGEESWARPGEAVYANYNLNGARNGVVVAGRGDCAKEGSAIVRLRFGRVGLSAEANRAHASSSS